MSACTNILTAVGIGTATAVAGDAGAGAIATAMIAGTAGWLAFANERHRWVALLRARHEQLAHTAHELRTPLTSVLTALEMVRGGYATTAAETDEFLAEADLAARHLGFLVNDVLDEAAITAGQLRMDLAEHRVQRLVTDALGLLGTQAGRRGLSIAASPVDPALAVVADARRVLQVLFNLLGNAVKFSSPGEPIRIEVTAHERAVRFAVVDAGPGVPVAMRARLFQPFSRGDAPGVTSTGLGLHITRLLVERMGGAIGYRPRPLRGSEFWFELPRAGAKVAIAPDPVAPR